MRSWSDHIDAATAAMKARLKAAQEAAHSDGVSSDSAPAAALERATAELETDLANVLKQVDIVATRASALENRAMQAIRYGDDARARE